MHVYVHVPMSVCAECVVCRLSLIPGNIHMSNSGLCMYIHVPVNTYVAAVNTDASELLRIKDGLQRSPFVEQGV